MCSPRHVTISTDQCIRPKITDVELLAVTMLFSGFDNGVHSWIITGRSEVVAKVMFLHVSVSLYTGGSQENLPQDQADTPPPGPRRTPPRQGEPPKTKENPPPGTKENPPGPGRTPQTRQTPPPN